MVFCRMLSWLYREYFETIAFCNNIDSSASIVGEGENISSPYQAPYRAHWYR